MPDHPASIGSLSELHQLISRPSDRVLAAVDQTPGSFAVLGAGGKMGFHLCLLLRRTLNELGRKDKILAVSRFGSENIRREFQDAGCKVCPTDLSDPDALQALPEVANVFYLAGIKFGSSDQPQQLQRLNVDMPQQVAQRFCRSRIVALSTGCVYSFVSPESGGATETAATNPPGAYAKSCLGREQAFVDAAQQFGTRSCLIRLNYAVDLRYGVLVDIAQQVHSGQPVSLQTGYVNVIWQGDALDQIVQTLTWASAPPQVFNITGAEILRVRDLATEFGRRFATEVQFEETEAETAWLSNPTVAHQLFGSPAVSVPQMLDWIAEWLQRGQPTLNKPTHFEIRDGNY